MDNTAGRYPAAPALLVRRATLVGEHDVAALLRAVPVDDRQVANLIRQDGVFVLADLTLPVSARPVGASPFVMTGQPGPRGWPVSGYSGRYGSEASAAGCSPAP